MTDILQDHKNQYPWLNNLNDYEEDCLRSLLNESYIEGKNDANREAQLEMTRNQFRIN